MHRVWSFPRLVAHRGGGTLAPENTLSGLRCGLAHGFHAAEFDVMLAQDGVPVVMHDERLGRTVARSGTVEALTAAELTRCDAGSWFGAEFAGEPVPTYRQVMDFCRANAIWMNVEIKPSVTTQSRTGEVVGMLTRDWLTPADLPPLFSSFSWEALRVAQSVAPAIARGWLVQRIPRDWERRLEQLAAVSLHVDHRTLTPQLAASIKQAGYGLFCYTVNTTERACELRDWGVDAFCTDRIDLFDAAFVRRYLS